MCQEGHEKKRTEQIRLTSQRRRNNGIKIQQEELRLDIREKAILRGTDWAIE